MNDMANFKRGRPKNRRAGCLMCKYWKINGVKGTKKGTKAKFREDMRLREM